MPEWNILGLGLCSQSLVEPLKRVEAWVGQGEKTIGDIVISHYGLESGLIYKQGRGLREQLKQGQPMQLHLRPIPKSKHRTAWRKNYSQ